MQGDDETKQPEIPQDQAAIKGDLALGESPIIQEIPPTPSDSPKTCKTSKHGNDNTPPWKKCLEISAFVVGLVYAIFTALMYCANRDSADAAKRAADTAAKQLEMAERPWVLVNIEIDTPLIFDSSGAHAGLVATFKNIGHSPAIRIWPDAEILPIEPIDMAKERERFCREREIPQSTNPSIGETLLPGGDTKQQWAMNISRKDIGPEQKVGQDSKTANGSIMPVVIVCVPYRSTFNHSVYHTERIFHVVNTAEGEKIPAFDMRVVDNGTIPRERLALHPYAMYAD
ncbi:MAG TPA: hypothetical protein VNW97_08565 [Candidatus Saccharimonadales bacterium]|jgi:hypothetical protein|nr:hypothetical protein [Candidatus Saccharimonadales bacterium]